MTAPTTRYVSPMLTHFVGHDDPYNLERQYDRLLEILRSGKLFPGGSPDTGPGIVLETNPQGTLHHETLFPLHAVCFCDIPIPDLPLHMTKYGKVGLAFRKSFLIRQGANPVFYIAASSRTIESPENRSARREEVFERVAKSFAEMLQREIETDPTSDDSLLLTLLGTQVFNFAKWFDDRAAERDETNFYMEREWRVPGIVEFTLSDVQQIILPRDYFEPFSRDRGDYHGELIAALQLPGAP